MNVQAALFMMLAASVSALWKPRCHLIGIEFRAWLEGKGLGEPAHLSYGSPSAISGACLELGCESTGAG